MRKYFSGFAETNILQKRNGTQESRKQFDRLRSRRAGQRGVWIYETMIKRWPWSATITEMVTRGNQVNWQIAIDRPLAA